MSRKSIGAQIRSVFNVRDPFSKEFSEDSSDDETIFNQSSKHNSTQDSQSSVNYLAHWSNIEENIEKEANSMFVNWDNSNVRLDTTEEVSASVTPNGLKNYFCMATPDDTKPNQKRQSAVSIEIPQENLRDVKVEPKSLNLSLASEEDATFDSNARRATSTQNLRKKIFQNLLQRKVIDFESSQTDVLLAPETPENNSQDIFKYDSEIIPDSDTSVLSNKSLYEI